MAYVKIEQAPSYEIGNDGSVRNAKTLVVRKLSIRNGYPSIRIISKKGKRKNFFVHRLVAEAFVEKPAGYRKSHVVLHLNDIRTDCRSENLRYGTQVENMQQHAKKMASLKTNQ